MDSQKFIKTAIKLVVDYFNEHIDETHRQVIAADDVYVVWSCKTLRNNKALLSTNIPDGMYYEVTFNGDKYEIYFDAYKKWENKCVKLEVAVWND